MCEKNRLRMHLQELVQPEAIFSTSLLSRWSTVVVEQALLLSKLVICLYVMCLAGT